VRPSLKKQAVEYLLDKQLCSERKACSIIGLRRSTYRYRLRPLTDQQQQLQQRIVALSWQHSRYGYRRIRALLEQEGWQVSRKQVQRIRRKEGLKVRPKPKKRSRRGVSTGLPIQATHRNHVWTWDFVFDRTENGGTLKMMTLLDEYTRQSLAIRVERQITAAQVLRTLWWVMTTYGIPEHIRSDNGPEFIAAKVRNWLRDNHIKTIYIEPGSPWQNGYIESFHSRFRDECLDREILLNLREARVVIEDWRQHYNRDRPHSQLGYRSPEAFIQAEINPILSHEVDQF
jgi:putative transposase